MKVRVDRRRLARVLDLRAPTVRRIVRHLTERTACQPYPDLVELAAAALASDRARVLHLPEHIGVNGRQEVTAGEVIDWLKLGELAPAAAGGVP